MKAWLGILTIVCFVGFPGLPAAAQEDKEEREETLDYELDDLEEDDYPDLVDADEDSELMDEFAFLEEELSDDEVESASKHRQSIFWSPSAITVITYEEIRSSGALTLHDILRRVPNFDIYELKPSYPLVGARTLTEEGNNLILVLVDDREILLELSGFTLWAALPININLVERIEVIRGPGSALYGSNAFAAVVNITTVSDNPVSYQDVFLSFGEQEYYYLLGRVCDYFSLGDGILSFNLDLERAERGHAVAARLAAALKPPVHFRRESAILRSGQYGHLRIRRRGAERSGFRPLPMESPVRSPVERWNAS